MAVTPLLFYALVWLIARMPEVCLGMGEECLRDRGYACVVSLVAINKFNVLLTGTMLGACLPFMFRIRFGRERASDYFPVMAGCVGILVAGFLSFVLFLVLDINLYHIDLLGLSVSLLTWGVGSGLGGWLGWRVQKRVDRPPWVQVAPTLGLCAYFLYMAVGLNPSTEHARMTRGGSLLVEYARAMAERAAYRGTELRDGHEGRYFIDHGLTGHGAMPEVIINEGERVWGPAMSSRWVDELAAIVAELPSEEYGEAVGKASREGVRS